MHPQSSSSRISFRILCAVFGALVACEGEGGDGMTDPPDGGGDDVELRKMAFLSYNIYGAGGVMPEGEAEEGEQYGVGDVRLYWVLDVIEAYSADVVGLQEVWWSREDTVYSNGRTTADSVGTLLGMHHWVERKEGAPFHSDAGLISRYPFVEKEYIDNPYFQRHFRRATLVDDFGEPWIVYNMHLAGYQENDSLKALRIKEFEFVRNHVLASDDTLAILMGDMNCSSDSMRAHLPGWTLIAAVNYPTNPAHDLDQVWISGDLSKVYRLGTVDLFNDPDYKELIDKSSDHHPAVGIVFLPVE